MYHYEMQMKTILYKKLKTPQINLIPFYGTSLITTQITPLNQFCVSGKPIDKLSS